VSIPSNGNPSDLSELDAEGVRVILETLCPATEVTGVRTGPGSYSNRLWIADTDEGELLVRVPGRNADPEYLRGSLVASRMAAEAGIPVTRLRAFAPSTVIGRPVVVQEFQPGERATDVLKRDPDAVTGLATTLGHWIGTLHGIRREEFGGVLGPGSGTDWPALVRSRVSGALAELDRDALPEDAVQIERVFEALLAETPDGGQASLVHGDLYFDNLLVRDGRATCLLDFEHAHFYDRFAEFGKLNELLFEWFPDSQEPFMEAYSEHFPAEKSDDVRRQLGIGLYELSQLAYFHRWQQDLVPVYRDRVNRWLSDR
jgi:aminoglycoside phosphotransferase (APT) family kinase protein